MSADPMLSPGQLVGESYRVERELGSGGMGVVYEASHLRVSRRFAIKVLRASLQSQPELLRRFRREAEVTSRLGHPHIVEVVDFDHPADGPPYLVMELLEGEDLAARVQREGAMPLVQCVAIARQTCSALHAAHQRGVVHRDLKPRNIFLARRGAYLDYVKVLDFGISKVLGAQAELTVEQMIIGTPGYMAPEQARGRSSMVDRRTDVFALGAILYYMLAGQPPFSAESQPATLYRIVHEEPAALGQLRPDLPAGVLDVVARALRKDREQRHPTMHDLWENLAHAAGMESGEWEWEVPTEDRLTTVPPGALAAEPGPRDTLLDPSPVPAATRRMREPPRRRLLLIAPLLLFGLAGIALLWFVFLGSDPVAPPPRRDATPPLARSAGGGPDAPALPDSQPGPHVATVGDSRPAPDSSPRRVPVRRPGRAHRVRRQVPRPRHASLHVVTSADEQPIWAEILVDGRPVGKSPVSVPRLGPGTHRVVARRQGYRQQVRRVRLRRGQRRVLMFKLRARK